MTQKELFADTERPKRRRERPLSAPTRHTEATEAEAKAGEKAERKNRPATLAALEVLKRFGPCRASDVYDKILALSNAADVLRELQPRVRLDNLGREIRRLPDRGLATFEDTPEGRVYTAAEVTP